MSTSVLYHAFGLTGYQYVSQHFEGGVISRIEQSRERLRCPGCDGAEVGMHGRVERTFRTLPIGGKPVFIQFDVPRVYCFDCGETRQVRIPFAEPKKRYNRAFERYVLDLSRHMTIKDMAEHLQVSWDTIKDIQALALQRRFGRPKLKHLKEIAIDEITIGKGTGSPPRTLSEALQTIFHWWGRLGTPGVRQCWFVPPVYCQPCTFPPSLAASGGVGIETLPAFLAHEDIDLAARVGAAFFVAQELVTDRQRAGNGGFPEKMTAVHAFLPGSIARRDRASSSVDFSQRTVKPRAATVRGCWAKSYARRADEPA